MLKVVKMAKAVAAIAGLLQGIECQQSVVDELRGIDISGFGSLQDRV